MALFPEISEQSVLYDLEMRYQQGQIYVMIILHSNMVSRLHFDSSLDLHWRYSHCIKSFRSFTNLQSQGKQISSENIFISSIKHLKISELYKNTQSIVSLPPHIYGYAERLYRNMIRERTSQCVVISGKQTKKMVFRIIEFVSRFIWQWKD